MPVGGQIGNDNARTMGFAWTRALQRQLVRKDASGVRALDRLAAKCIQMGLDGNMAAIQECSNRLEGKPIQPLAGQQAITVTVRQLDVLRPAIEGQLVHDVLQHSTQAAAGDDEHNI